MPPAYPKLIRVEIGNERIRDNNIITNLFWKKIKYIIGVM